MCELEQITLPLCASVTLSVNWEWFYLPQRVVLKIKYLTYINCCSLRKLWFILNTVIISSKKIIMAIFSVLHLRHLVSNLALGTIRYFISLLHHRCCLKWEMVITTNNYFFKKITQIFLMKGLEYSAKPRELGNDGADQVEMKTKKTTKG